MKKLLIIFMKITNLKKAQEERLRFNTVSFCTFFNRELTKLERDFFCSPTLLFPTPFNSKILSFFNCFNKIKDTK